MSVPSQQYPVNGSVEKTIRNAWQNTNGKGVVILTYKRQKSQSGQPYFEQGEIEFPRKRFRAAEDLIDHIGQVEADLQFASRNGKWIAFTIPPR